MTKAARELLELMGCRVRKNCKGCYDLVIPFGVNRVDFVEPDAPWSAAPDLEHDLNALAEVWKVLKEKGLWEEFWRTYSGMGVHPVGVNDTIAKSVHLFLTDTKGQIEAARDVLKEAK